MDISALIEKYRALRDKKKAIEDEHKKVIAPYNEAMEKIEAAVLAFLDKTKQDAAKTASGTAYISTRVSITTADAEAFRKFCNDNDLNHLIEVRPAKAAVEEYMQANGGALPPGLNYSSERVVNFRKN